MLPRRPSTRVLPLLVLPLLLACGESSDDDEGGGATVSDHGEGGGATVSDHGELCVDGSLALVAHSGDCSRDHDGVAYSCEATLDGDTVTASTTYTPGDDPNDLCAGPIVVPCGITLEEGPHTLVYRGASHEVEVQRGATVCVPSGGAFDTGL